MGRKVPFLERLRRKTVVTESGCWLYVGGAPNPRGGHRRIRTGPDRREKFVHRASYELFVGPIPSGLNVLHRCDVPNCFNPAHLFLGTQAVNIQDCIAKKRRNTIVGEKTYNAKLTVEIVRELRSRIQFKGCRSAWGKEFGVDPGAISAVLNGRQWKNVG